MELENVNKCFRSVSLGVGEEGGGKCFFSTEQTTAVIRLSRQKALSMSIGVSGMPSPVVQWPIAAADAFWALSVGAVHVKHDNIDKIPFSAGVSNRIYFVQYLSHYTVVFICVGAIAGVDKAPSTTSSVVTATRSRIGTHGLPNSLGSALQPIGCVRTHNIFSPA